MTGTDEFGHELDAQGYERVAGPADGVRPDQRATAPRPRGPQPVGQPMPGQVPQDAPWLTGAASGQGYAEPAFGAQQQRPAGSPMPGQAPMAAPMPGVASVTVPQSMPTGHDAPTAEFPRIYDGGAPEDYQVPPASAAPTLPRSIPRLPAQPGPDQQQPFAHAQQQMADVSGGPMPQQAVGRPGPVPQQMSAQPPQMAAVPQPAVPAPQFAQPQQLQQDPDELGYPEQEFDPLSGSASWSAAPPRTGQAAQQTQAQRPAVPAQPMPGPAPLPERGAARSGVRSGGAAAAGAVAAGRAAVRQQSAAQTEADPLASSGQRQVSDPLGSSGQRPTSDPLGSSGQRPTSDPLGSSGQRQVSDPLGSSGQRPTSDPLGSSGQRPTSDPLGSSGQRQAVVPQQAAAPTNLQQAPQTVGPNVHQDAGLAGVQQMPQSAPSVFEPVNQTAPGPVYQDPQAQSGAQQVQARPQVQQQPQAPASPDDTVSMRETMAPPRRRVSATQPPAGQPQARQSGASAADDLSSERLRSVAPSVPAARRVPDDSAQDLPAMPPPAAQSGPVQSVQVPVAQRPARFEEEGGQDADELIVPWQSTAATAQPAAEGFTVAPVVPRGTRRRAETSVDEAVPEPLSAPQPVLLDPEPGDDEDDLLPQAASGVYEPEFQHEGEGEGEDDPLSGSGAHARPGRQGQIRSQPSAQQPEHEQQPEQGQPVQPQQQPGQQAQSPQVTQPQGQQTQQQQTPQQPVQQQAALKETVNPAIRRPGTQAAPPQSAQDAAVGQPQQPPAQQAQQQAQQPVQRVQAGQQVQQPEQQVQSAQQVQLEQLGQRVLAGLKGQPVQPERRGRQQSAGQPPVQAEQQSAAQAQVQPLQAQHVQPEERGQQQSAAHQQAQQDLSEQQSQQSQLEPQSQQESVARPQAQAQQQPQGRQSELEQQGQEQAVARPQAQRLPSVAQAQVQQPQVQQSEPEQQQGQAQAIARPQAQRAQSAARRPQSQQTESQQAEAQQTQPESQQSESVGAQARPATQAASARRGAAKSVAPSAGTTRAARTRTQQAAEASSAPATPVAATPARAAKAPASTVSAAKITSAASDIDDDGSRAPGYGEDALEAVYRVIHERRDIRNDFLSDELPTEVLTRILEAAHTAPSVGFSQPWDFLVLRDEERRQAVHDLAVRQRRAYAASLPKARAKAFAALKIESILDTPVNIVVTCDPTRGGRHTLGRYTQPMMAPFSTCLAVENLWLAARAEGLGVGWVSFFDERELAETLGLPEHLQIVAYLCVGYVKRFPSEPELAGAGWAKRRPLSWAVHEEDYGRRAMPGGAPVSLLDATVDAVRGLDEVAVAAARDRQGRMTKPPGSLGMLEQVAEQLAGLAGECPPPLPEPAALAVFAADHGVHAQGVTPWPQEVTAQMVSNFLAGGAVVNAFAKQVGAEVCVVDVGVNANLGNASGLVPRKVRFGTADMTQGPAMSRDEAVAAIEAGIETARDLVAAGNRCLLTGDMGIANTTASAALIAAFTGASPAQVTGYGTGIDEQTYAHKVEIVRRALELHRPDPQDPIGVLAAFGGLEHAALAGFILGGSALRTPVVLDGVIAGAAALVAQAIAPEVTAACVAGHRSAEPGHALALEALGVNPLIDLELRLGEGSGAVLALPLVAASVRALREVATFDSAGVADASSAAVAPAERGRPA